MPACKRCRKRLKAPLNDGRFLCKPCNHVRVSTDRRRRRVIARKWVRKYVHDHPCVDCGERDWQVLEFDHRLRTMKKAQVSDLITNGASIARIQEEIAECDVRCANCHRRRTIKQLGWYK